MRVLRSGKCQGSKTSMPFGGQWPPVKAKRANSLVSPENRLELKKAQNHATKNITSEAMKRIMP